MAILFTTRQLSALGSQWRHHKMQKVLNLTLKITVSCVSTYFIAMWRHKEVPLTQLEPAKKILLQFSSFFWKI